MNLVTVKVMDHHMMTLACQEALNTTDCVAGSWSLLYRGRLIDFPDVVRKAIADFCAFRPVEPFEFTLKIPA